MKRILLTLSFILFFCSNALADLKVAVVDYQKVLQQAKAAKNAQEQIKKKRDTYQNEIAKQEEQIRKDDADLAKQRSLLSQDAFESKQSEFKSKFMKFQSDVQKKRASMDDALTKALSEINVATVKVIGELSKERGFNIVLPTSQILYSEPSMDVTDEVLKRLDKTLSKVDIKQ